MKEAIINEIKRVLGTKPKDFWYNNNTEHYQEWEFGKCIPFVILKEYLLGEGYKEDNDTVIWKTNGWEPNYYYKLISPNGHKCFVKGNTYYGQLKLCINMYPNIFYVARDEDGKLKLTEVPAQYIYRTKPLPPPVLPPY